MPRTSSATPMATARIHAGLTQQDVADRWCTRWPDDPRSAKTVHYWETGTRSPSVASVRRLAVVLDCSVAVLLGEEAPAPLAVALAVVTLGRRVLLVHNRESGRWQLPAGTVKPGADPQRVAVRETRAETGVHTAARAVLGSRVHPRTRALCHYIACDHVAGDATNLDADENIDVMWAPIAALAEFVPLAELYGPVREHLGVSTACLTLTG